jgi:FkbH-like protein
LITSQPKGQSEDILLALEPPIDFPTVLRKRHQIKEILLEKGPRIRCRIAILGGSTTAEVRSALEIFLLHRRIEPEFYESEYGRFSEDVLFENPELEKFQPQIAYIHTTRRNIRSSPALGANEDAFEAELEREIERFRAVWEKIGNLFPSCTVIQNNFDLPSSRPLGNLEAGSYFGQVAFVNRLNFEFAKTAAENPKLFIQDIQSLAADLGSDKWFDPNYWFSYKLATTPYACAAIGSNLANMIAALYGRTRKCLVLDLDNTLWGGVVGDDGVANLKLGSETALAESYLAFQQYVSGLKSRGILLAVCSKNEEAAALEGLRHPDGVLRPEDFAVIKANWAHKHENIAEIAETLNIGLDSLVFVDDNPVERAIVRLHLPEVLVPEVGTDPSGFAALLEQSGCFEVLSVSDDDLKRNRFYEENNARKGLESSFGDYGSFLMSLEMEAEIKPFSAVYQDRITQLTNKTNQFNTTTRRYTRAEIELIAEDPRYIHLYGRLKDKFGDNGLVSVVIGEIQGQTLSILLWLMSCRVLKRGMEEAMMDTLVCQCRIRGIERVDGHYLPTRKNAMVADLYGQLGFEKVSGDDLGSTAWQFKVPSDYSMQNRFIKVSE